MAPAGFSTETLGPGLVPAQQPHPAPAVRSTERPLLFACSGCSNAGQLANDVAHALDRRGVAEMSCLAGVGAAKPLFLKKLKNREVWVIDGCPIHCGAGVFDQVREHVDMHIRLHDLGIKKKAEPPTGQDFDELIEAVLRYIRHQRITENNLVTPSPEDGDKT